MSTSSFRAIAAVVVLAATAVARVGIAEQPAVRTPVHLVATLYSRHADTPAYDHAALRRVIDAIAPDVMVLDVSPDELAKREVSPGKQEYPRVIFPWLDAHDGVVAYAGEPGQPMFDEIVQSTIAVHEAFGRDRADDKAALDHYTAATYGVLARHWTSPAAVNDAFTAELLGAKRRASDAMIGGADADGWRRWNDHAATIVRQAVREHRGRRIIVLTGVENRPELERRLRGDAEIELVPVVEGPRDCRAAR